MGRGGGVERRLAAILAADVVGYSRLMEADEAGTHARLKALRKEFIEPLVAEHRGRVVKLTGDGALVEFRASSTRCRARSTSSAASPSATPRSAGSAHRVPDRGQSRRRDHRGRRHLWRWRERRGPARGLWPSRAASASRHVVHRPRQGQARLAFERSGEQQVKNIAEPVRGLPAWRHAARPRRRVRSPRPRCLARQALDRRAAVRQSQRRSGAGAPSPTASPRTSSPTCRGFATCSSSPATRPSSTRASRWTCVRSRASSACNTSSKAACSPMATVRITAQLIDAEHRQSRLGGALRSPARRCVRDPGRGDRTDCRNAGPSMGAS